MYHIFVIKKLCKR